MWRGGSSRARVALSSFNADALRPATLWCRGPRGLFGLGLVVVLCGPRPHDLLDVSYLGGVLVVDRLEFRVPGFCFGPVVRGDSVVESREDDVSVLFCEHRRSPNV